jgi:ribosomal protein S18 acetylase RimI-like enzyme
MNVRNCQLADLPPIIRLYQAARELQTERNMVVWPDFPASFIEAEIMEQRQWKIQVGDEMVCNWAITFSDRDIWEDRDKDDSIFIHRICTHPKYRGNRYIDTIVAWAKKYALQHGKSYVRLDTLGNNTNLIKHYTSAGFDFLGIFQLKDTSALPQHYQNESDCCLFEIKL